MAKREEYLIEESGPAAVPPPPPPPKAKPKLTVDQLAEGIHAGDRTILSKAITLVESNAGAHIDKAQQLLAQIMPRTGRAARVGITGVPGVGKSTFIECLGTKLAQAGQKVAVLAIDPSSGLTGGSILGDKTRMANLSIEPNAFIRPSPSGGALGGVTRKTRETMLLCEAAGFDVILIETVGVGQSETTVREMTDFFLALMLPGAGDELQGIKRGVLEVSDMIAVNKADGDNATRAGLAAGEYRAVVSFMVHPDPHWTPPVRTCSGATGEGVDELWLQIAERIQSLRDSGKLDTTRREQTLRWMWSMVDEGLSRMLAEHPQVSARKASLQDEVRQGTTPPTAAAQELLKLFGT